MLSKNLGVVSTPLRCFQKWFWTNKVGPGVKKELEVFPKKRHW
jgi:hypothetical protein